MTKKPKMTNKERNLKLAKLVKEMELLTPSQRRELCKDKFGLFFAYYLGHYIKIPAPPFHAKMDNRIERLAGIGNKIRSDIWVTHRESAKTSKAKGALIWFCAYKKFRNIGALSRNINNSKAYLASCATAFSLNKRIIQDFGELWSKTRRQDDIRKVTQNIMQLANGVQIVAGTPNADPFRGALKEEDRLDFCFIDDFEDKVSCVSKAETDAIRENIDSVISGLDAKTGCYLMLSNYLTSIGNADHYYKKIKETYDLGLFIPLIKDGKLSWPEKFTFNPEDEKFPDGTTKRLSIDEYRKFLGGAHVFNVEMLLMPLSEEDRAFKRSMFSYIDMQAVRNKTTRCFVTVDPAYTKRSTSDYTGITINFVDQENKWNIKAYHKRLSPKEIVEELFSLNAIYKPEVFGIEKFAFTAGLKPYLDEQMRVRNTFFEVKEMTNNGDNKELRIKNALLALYESGTIIHIEGECADLEDEALRFPLAEHDDILDSLAYQVEIAEAPYKTNQTYRPGYSTNNGIRRY